MPNLFGGNTNTTIVSLFSPRAVEGAHYTGVTNTLTFMHGEAAKSFLVPVSESWLFESNHLSTLMGTQQFWQVRHWESTNATVELKAWESIDSEPGWSRAYYYII